MQLFTRNAAGLRRALMAWGVLLALAPAAFAQSREQIGVNVPFLVKDINTTASQRLDSNPRDYLVIGSVAYFVATDPAWGEELWRTDGTAAGTWMVKDINPGAGSSRIDSLANMNGTLYFTADDGIHGSEPWKSDGTAAGTRMIKNIWPGNSGSVSFTRFTYANGKIYFNADDGVHGLEIWRTDGTEAGTSMLEDFNPGIKGSNPSAIVALNGMIYFTAMTQEQYSYHYRFYKSNGTAAGTVALKDLGSATNFGEMVALGGKIYFITQDANGNYLWKSDGTAAGTTVIRNFPLSYYLTNLNSLVNLNGVLYFLHLPDDGTTLELWKSNGTTSGTVRLKSVKASFTISDDNTPFPYLISDGSKTLYFVAYDTASGTEVWKSDGTAAGTRLLKDVRPGQDSSSPANLQASGGKIYFTANDGAHGKQFWRSDGTAAGTRMVTNAPTIKRSQTHAIPPVAPVTPKGTLFFSGSDPVHGTEPWRSDGTTASTMLVKEIARGSDASLGHLAAAGGTLFFSANDMIHGQELWQSKSTAASTGLVKDIQPGKLSGLSPENASIYVRDPLTTSSWGSFRSQLLTMNGVAYFTASDGKHGVGLWRSDGTTAGTSPIRDRFLTIWKMVQNQGRIFFFTSDAAGNFALWRTNATNTGAAAIKFFAKNSYVATGSHSIADVNGTIYFLLNNQIWKSDGTTAGTVMVTGTYPNDQNLVAMNGRIYFVSGDRDHSDNLELWTTNGTDAGTRRVRDIMPGPGSSNIWGLTVVGKTLYFSASDGVNGHELWKSDGTEAGTVMVKDIWAGPGRSYPTNMTAVGGTLYFNADDGIHGPELWRSNGTAAGTVLVSDINPGAYGSNPSSLVNVYGTLYFNAFKPGYGNELWKSNGTPAGTTLVSDAISPGAKGANPTKLTLVGNFLYFEAANSTTFQGRELWALRVR